MIKPLSQQNHPPVNRLTNCSILLGGIIPPMKHAPQEKPIYRDLRFVRRWLAALDGCRGQPRPPAGGVSQALGPRAAGKVSGQSLCGWSGRRLQLWLAVRGAALLRSCLERCCAVTFSFFSFAALVCCKLAWTRGLQAGSRLLRLHERVRELHVVGWLPSGVL